MKLINIFIFLFISLTISIKVNSNENLIDNLKDGGKLIFIRHAHAPGNSDPKNFNIKDCSTQRNLDQKGMRQSKQIGLFFKNNSIQIDKVLSSEWCRCKETAFLAFINFEKKSFLNSFYDQKFAKNKNKQIYELKRYINSWSGEKNLILVTHYVVISEILNVFPSSGEIVISDKNYNVIDTMMINY
jgi:phosphohistidine phosphatase SixA